MFLLLLQTQKHTKMGCVKLHILNEQYKSTELKVSYINKKLTSDFSGYFLCRYSFYSAFGNNPLKNIDPDGRDWYWINDDELRYDPKVNQYSVLAPGHRYAGATVEHGTGMYRADGSIMFSNEADAYNRMWSYANSYDKEVLSVILDNGVLVLPTHLNSRTDATPAFTDFGYFTNGKFTDVITGTQSDYVGTIHTHQNPNRYYVNVGLSDWDIYTFSRFTPNKPYLSMEQNNTISAYMNNSPIRGLDKSPLQRIFGSGFSLRNEIKKYR